MFKKNYTNDIIMGFSINLKYINIKYKENILKFNDISKFWLKIKKNEILEIIPSKLNTNYVIYINLSVVNLNFNLNLTQNLTLFPTSSLI